MDTTPWTHGTPVAMADLPSTITTYLTAHVARDLDAAIPHYADDAAVTDEGQTHTGHREIRSWLASAASEYTYSVEPTAAMRYAADRYDVTHHFEGDFPGGVADLHFWFTMRNDRIARLVIEP
jgi:hypothetical protein